MVYTVSMLINGRIPKSNELKSYVSGSEVLSSKHLTKTSNK